VPLTRTALLARTGVVALLLLPWAGTHTVTAAGHRCAISAPALAVDVKRACAVVRAAVPGWDGRAAVVHGPSDGNVAAETVGRTVTLRAAGWAALSPVGRQEVLTHELVHVATDSFTTTRTPTWLVEGFAEAVALRDSGLADAVVAQELRAAHARGWLPQYLPGTREFAVRPALAYQESWLAVRLLQRRYGDRAVLGLYRAAGEQPLAAALRGLGREGAALASRRQSQSSDAFRSRVSRAMTVPLLVAAVRAEIVSRLS
jgi:hypothetical protein